MHALDHTTQSGVIWAAGVEWRLQTLAVLAFILQGCGVVMTVVSNNHEIKDLEHNPQQHDPTYRSHSHDWKHSIIILACELLAYRVCSSRVVIVDGVCTIGFLDETPPV